MKFILHLVLTALLFGSGAVSASTDSLKKARMHTPVPGTMERRAVLDGLRYWVRSRLGVNVRFVVHHLKISGGWAWVVTDPQSPDGTQHYEPISALLKKGKNCWVVVALPSGECAAAADPEQACRESDRRFIRAVTGNPLFVPAEIFR